jgi:hypothetical protein
VASRARGAGVGVDRIVGESDDEEKRGLALIKGKAGYAAVDMTC